MKLEDFLQRQYNYNPDIKDNIRQYYEQWNSWYEGNVKSFHNYYVWNGRKKVDKTRYTLNMAKEISEDWADILWSEKCAISMDNEQSQEQFDELVNDLDLYVLINQVLEQAGALGTEATVTSVYNLIQNEDGMYLDISNAKTRVNSIGFEGIFPLSWNNKEVTECAFSSVEYVNGQKYVILSVHLLNNAGNYIINNHLFRDVRGTLTEIIDLENTLRTFDTKNNIKWFSIFKPLITNNLFKNNPFGIPYYANAIDKIKAVDITFDALKDEINDGKKRTFARADMFSYDDGQQRLVFDPNDTTIYQLPDGANKDDLIQSDSDSLRTSDQIATLNTQLNILGNSVGFGENYYHFDGTNLSTATAVVSSNSKMFRRKRKLEVGYESAIYDLVKSVCYASTAFGTYNINTDNMVVQFDDSIIEDLNEESNRALRELSAGVISKVEYRMQIKGETKDIAEAKIAEIKENEPSMRDLLGE